MLLPCPAPCILLLLWRSLTALLASLQGIDLLFIGLLEGMRRLDLHVASMGNNYCHNGAFITSWDHFRPRLRCGWDFTIWWWMCIVKDRGTMQPGSRVHDCLILRVLHEIANFLPRWKTKDNWTKKWQQEGPVGYDCSCDTKEALLPELVNLSSPCECHPTPLHRGE
jgi:hypothetical protein